MRESTVLVVDDSSTIRKVVETTLQKENIRVCGAPDGLSALAGVMDENPDLVLLDIMLAHLDGYQVCQIIRKNPDYKRLPIVMLSGKDGVFDKLKGRLAGSSGYITKPFDPKHLVRVVNRHLNGK
ncbi:MAG: response regulator [Chloroflexi bacterium]|nr:response regulator [Chloroflexota bacterium]